MMQKYEPGVDEDLRLLQWWLKMRRDGDLDRVFEGKARSLSEFYTTFFKPTILVYEPAGASIDAAAWMVPIMGGAFFGLWVAKEQRKSKRMATLILETYIKALAMFPVLMGITKQEALLAQHERLGYTVSERIPKFFDGEDAWLVTLTREKFLWGRRAMLAEKLTLRKAQPQGALTN